MNAVAEEMKAILSGELSPEDVLMHIGMPRRSGRYPWGSGKDPYQHARDFLGRVEELRKQNFTYTDEYGKTWEGDTAIAKEFGLTTNQFRTELGICRSERRQQLVDTAKRLRDKEGLGNSAIGREMGLPESTVRSLLNERSESRMNQAKETAAFLKDRVDSVEYGMVDIGKGVNYELNISNERMQQAVYLLQREGYEVWKGGIPQVTNKGQQTNQVVLCKPGTPHSAIYEFDKVSSVKDYISRDDGKSFEKKFNFPESLDSKRLMIRYKEDGGIDKDGVVELRPGVKDLSLGESRFSQVRIMVDGTHYIKGMAVYGDPKDFPPGVDAIFNTNKSNSKSKLEVLKPVKTLKDGSVDRDNPFGSLIKDADKGGQYWYEDENGKKKLGLINKRADEGDWSEWADATPSQFLSKQSTDLAKRQLKIARDDRNMEYEEICALTNPTIKKHLLNKFADECDSAAVHLKGAALPGQKYHVIIPNNTLKDSECYAPGYENGTKLALIRYPHGGTFEIPMVTVNNKNALGKKLIGTDTMDGICVNSKVAERLSGADFDGDTVMAIPTSSKIKITATKQLDDLIGFDPKLEYSERPGMRYMKDPVTGKDNTQNEMGRISNLITDMTLGGANEAELARAVKHSMVVIDAAKHKLDYKRSEIDNNIAELRNSYQLKYDKRGNLRSGGASTLISKSSGEATVDKKKGTPHVNQKGKKWYDPTRPEGTIVYTKSDDIYYVKGRKFDKDTGLVTIRTADKKKITYDPKNKEEADKYTPVKVKDSVTGEVKFVSKDGKHTYLRGTQHQKSTNMAETDDAYTLVSRNRWVMELVYADHANAMKAMANRARMEMLATGKIQYDKNAKKIYQKEVDDLNQKLKVATLNKPRERAAQRSSNAEMAIKKADDPNMSNKDYKKQSQQAISKYRTEVGAVERTKRNIKITDREWDAIQAGAISESTLKSILDNTDIASLRERATPRNNGSTLTPAKVNRIRAMSDSNLTISQIAQKLGVSTSTVSKYLKGKDEDE